MTQPRNTSKRVALIIVRGTLARRHPILNRGNNSGTRPHFSSDGHAFPPAGPFYEGLTTAPACDSFLFRFGLSARRTGSEARVPFCLSALVVKKKITGPLHILRMGARAALTVPPHYCLPYSPPPPPPPPREEGGWACGASFRIGFKESVHTWPASFVNYARTKNFGLFIDVYGRFY
jgi:hypothetical protein